MTHELPRTGWRGNAKRVPRVMREASLLCQRKRRFVRTTEARHGLGSDPNLRRDQGVSRPNQVWVADITSIRLPPTCCSLATILDAWSRRCVGWHLSPRIDTDLPLAALEHAIHSRRPTPGLIHHSDHGVQYAMGCSTPPPATWIGGS